MVLLIDWPINWVLDLTSWLIDLWLTYDSLIHCLIHSLIDWFLSESVKLCFQLTARPLIVYYHLFFLNIVNMRKGNKNAPTGQENHVKISANTSPKTTIIHSVPTEWTLQQILPCLVNILCRLNFILPLNSLLWPHPTRKKGSLIWKAHTNNVSSFLHWGHVFTSFIIGVWILRSISFKLFNDEQIFF